MNHLNEQQFAELLAASPHELRELPAGSDLTAIVRKYPIQSVLISLGVGIWLARGGKR